MTIERDPNTRNVLSWLREDAHENAERVLLRALDEVDTTPQRRSLWPAWRTFHMGKLAVTTAAAVAVLVVAVVGYNLLPNLAILAPGGTPSLTLLARGSFVAGFTVEIEAFAQGSSITGQMTATETGSDSRFTVDLECARATADGSILIGGVTTKGNPYSLQGNYAAIAIKPGSPVRAAVWTQYPGTRSESCPAYLEEQSWRVSLGMQAIEGTVELGASSAWPPATGGELPAGPHSMGIGLNGEDRVTVTIPAPGWSAPNDVTLTKDLGGGDHVTLVTVPGDYFTVPGSICDWELTDEPKRFPATADEFVTNLMGQTYDVPGGLLTRDFSDPENITIDGANGLRMVDQPLSYPDSDPSTCDQQRFCSVQDRDGWECLLSHTEPGALDTLWIVEPRAPRNYFQIVVANGTPGAELRAEMNALVESMTFVVE